MYGSVKVLDVHGHVTVPRSANVPLVYMLGSNTPIGRSGSLSSVSGVSEEEFHEAAAGHAAYMDERNIDVQILGPRPFLMMGWMEPHLLPSWVGYINDMIHQQCQFFPGRFLGAATLPQLSDAEDLSNCLPELDRCVRELGFVAAYASPDPGGHRSTPGMHEPYWYPLYERCQELDIPLIVHGTNSLDPRFGVVPHNYQLGFLTEQYLAGQFLGHSDVFDRFPELRVIICHCGGALNRFIPTDHHIAQRDLTRNLFYDTCGYDELFLSAAIQQRGVGQMCFGTEAPGSGRAVRPETGRTSDDLVPVIDKFDFLSQEDKHTIFHANPVKVVPGFATLAQ
jgi:predicted TIM-barrel fold metal-dependent hydrolase